MSERSHPVSGAEEFPAPLDEATRRCTRCSAIWRAGLQTEGISPCYRKKAEAAAPEKRPGALTATTLGQANRMPNCGESLADEPSLVNRISGGTMIWRYYLSPIVAIQSLPLRTVQARSCLELAAPCAGAKGA